MRKTYEKEDPIGDSLRPTTLSQFIGQRDVKSNLKVFMDAAKARGETLDHVLLFGPPGLGKTSLAEVISNYMDGDLINVSGPALEKPGDIAAILSSLKAGDVLFIDEVHAMPKAVEEILYSAMEDYRLAILIKENGVSKSLNFDLPPFTLVAATTKPHRISGPLRSRFGISLRLDFYPSEELSQIVERSSAVLLSKIDSDAAMEIGKRSRGTPRIANRLLRRVRDFSMTDDGRITIGSALNAFKALGVDELGLEELDRSVLRCIREKFGGGPVGLGSVALAIGEDEDTILSLSEPYLVHQGLLERTPRGRKLTENGLRHISK